jgi:hypothetical protein
MTNVMKHAGFGSLLVLISACGSKNDAAPDDTSPARSAASTDAGGILPRGAGSTKVDLAAQEFELTTASFTVPRGVGDVYKCESFKNPMNDDVAILDSESTMSPGSHHMFVFHGTGFNTDGPLIDSEQAGATACSGVTFPSDFLHAAQTQEQALAYPTGVGRLLAAGDGLYVVAHYINLGEEDLTAQVKVKFHYVPRNQVQYLASEIFLNQLALVVPASPATSAFASSYTTPFAMTLLGDVSHMHRRGTAFKATTNTGVTLYEGSDWDEPTATAYPSGLEVPAGTQITWQCAYDNTTGTALPFGESASTNEMCIMSGSLYSKDPAHQGEGMNNLVGSSSPVPFFSVATH